MKHLKIQPDSPTPKVKQIEELIRKKIETGEFEPGLKLPSMQNLADHLGVSLGIVKLALHTLTVEGFVNTVPKVGVFVPEQIPTKDIALILPSAELEQIPRIIHGVRTSLPRRYRLMIEAAANDFDGQVDIVKYLNKSHIKGMILMSPHKQRYAEKLRPFLSEELPCVQILFELDGLATDSATFDGFEMGFLAADHLIQSGHRQIGLIATDADAITFSARNEGLDNALKTIGQSYDTLPKEINSAEILNADDPSTLGQQAAEKLLKKHPDLTAIIAENGHIALGAIQAIKNAGKSIPKDLSVLSMGIDLPTFKHMTPSVTALDEPVEKICQRAAQMLIKRIENPGEIFRSVHFSPELHSRESVRTLS